jgi:hypothetical protein
VPPSLTLSEQERAWEWLRYLIVRRLAEPTPERKALWFYHIEEASRTFVELCEGRRL